MSEVLKPCPFCGSSNVKSGGDDKIVGSWCLNCEASGPNGYLTTNGEHDWNTRASQNAEHLEHLEIENTRLRGALKLIAKTRLQVTRHFSGPSPEDELDATVLAMTAEYLQEIASDALRTGEAS